MIAYVSGTLAYAGDNYIVVDRNGLGYKMYVSGRFLDSVPRVGAEVKVFTHMYVREDEISLYGFPSKEELEVFKVLIGISGVGPKVALSVLTALTIEELHMAVMAEDAKSIAKANGIGAKGASRIILELKDKLKIEDMLDVAYDAAVSVERTADATKDVMEALTSWGYSNTEAYRAIGKVAGAEAMDSDKLLKEALKHLA